MKIRTALFSSILALLIVGGATSFFMHQREAGMADVPMAAAVPAVEAVPEPVPAPAFDFEVVASAAARAQGLSSRSDVPSGYGMLFVFDQPDRYGFWMKDMLVPIDMIWLASDGTIVGIEESVSPATYPTPFYPPRPVRLVLETRAGEARAQGWTVGTRIPLPL